jgi:hypothetical protein
MSGPHYISSSNREATGHAAAVYLSPGDVAAYRAAILGAGYVLGGLLSCEFPKAELVSEALYAVTKVVGVYGLEGKWVTSWASGARSEFLATSEVREVSAIVIFVSCGQHVFFVAHSRCSI